jgi:peptidylprolyl isomerase
MLKRKTLPLILAVLALAGAVAGCGSSSASGIVLAPSAGATADTATAASASASATTTSTTSAPATPLPSALKTKPKVVPPKGAAPKKLVVKDLIKGTGPAVTSPSQTLSVQYVGVLYKNGKQFDASWDHPGGQPTQIPLSNVIAGWQQGLIGMKVGGRRELIIPPSLGYKAAGSPPKIPGNAPLEFVIDLHSVSG